jgi:BTB/POZ domain
MNMATEMSRNSSMSNKRTFHNNEKLELGDDIDVGSTDDLNWADLLYGHNSSDETPSRNTNKRPATGSLDASFSFSDTPIRVLPMQQQQIYRTSPTGDASHRTTDVNPIQHLHQHHQQFQEQQQHQQQQQQYQNDRNQDYDSDTEPSPVFLDWRSERTKSFSDWQIDIVVVRSGSNRNGEPTVRGSYHVHRNILVVESEYFQRLFSAGRPYVESENSTSTIELVEEGAASFEALLDYMYRPGEPNLTSNNAVAMHHFGEYFGMKRLRWLARHFWKKDMNTNTVATYYKHAGLFLDEKVMNEVKKRCCSIPFLIEAGANGLLLNIRDPQLWFFLLKNFNGMHSIPMSAFVTEYCERHHVDAVTFVQMTANSVLPEIFFDVAQQLVELERKILGDHVDVTCLQGRCISALAKEWKNIDVSSDTFTSFLANQSSKFSAELFKKSMLAARSFSEEAIQPVI